MISIINNQQYNQCVSLATGWQNGHEPRNLLNYLANNFLAFWHPGGNMLECQKLFNKFNALTLALGISDKNTYCQIINLIKTLSYMPWQPGTRCIPIGIKISVPDFLSRIGRGSRIARKCKSKIKMKGGV